MNKSNIPLKYKIPLQGIHNKTINICPECNYDLILFSDEAGYTFDNIIGFAESNIGTMAVVECPKCFSKWYFHAPIPQHCGVYEYFLDAIKKGTQKYYNDDH